MHSGKTLFLEVVTAKFCSGYHKRSRVLKPGVDGEEAFSKRRRKGETTSDVPVNG